MTAYATAADMIARYDVRTIGDLVFDDGTAADSSDISSSSVVTAALDDAAGEIEAALLRGGRYTRADLQSLTGNSLSYLKRINCKLAFWYLWERRPAWDNDQYEQSKADARRVIQQLASGQEIFDLDKVVDAGTPMVTAPTQAEFDRRNLPIERFSRFYPPRVLPG